METAIATFDVFLSHNSRDKDTVERIAEHLSGAGVEPWLDLWALTPGGAWQDELAPGLEASVGLRGVRRARRPRRLGTAGGRAGASTARRRTRGFRVFPVLLPGVRRAVRARSAAAFLRTGRGWTCGAGTRSARALQDLIHAIKGIPFGPAAGRAAATTSARTAACRPSTRSTPSSSSGAMPRSSGCWRS